MENLKAITLLNIIPILNNLTKKCNSFIIVLIAGADLVMFIYTYMGLIYIYIYAFNFTSIFYAYKCTYIDVYSLYTY